MQQADELHILQCGFSREIKVIKPHTKKQRSFQISTAKNS